jgi:hypothetical protein
VSVATENAEKAEAKPDQPETANNALHPRNFHRQQFDALRSGAAFPWPLLQMSIQGTSRQTSAAAELDQKTRMDGFRKRWKSGKVGEIEPCLL